MNKKANRLFRYFIYIFMGSVLFPDPVYAMHIMEGFLPVNWAIFWWIAMLPFIAFGFRSIRSTIKGHTNLKMLLIMVGAFAFVLSALKIPSVTGSSSHLTGLGLGAILFGPWAMGVIGVIILTFQALLLAHGGITTLGANTFSMGIVGPFVAYGLYRACQALGLSRGVSVFSASALGSLFTYITTSWQLALAFPSESGGILTSAMEFMTIFAFTQVPLAVIEGLLTAVVFNLLFSYSSSELNELSSFGKHWGTIEVKK